MFISHGDFSFPFDWVLYWIKHFYIWSFQSGAPNPDGVIRLPGRIFNFVVFALSGNIGVAYFYALFSLLVAFLAFFYFTRYFLGIQNRTVQFVAALFFAINPIVLGNLAKVGLVLAAAMLPLCLMAIKAVFEKRQPSYLFLYVLCLNISLIHPYTLAVNLAVSGIYLLYQAWLYSPFFIKQLPKFIGIGVVTLLLHAYFILPMASLGTISKDVLSDSASTEPVDYTALVDLSTGDALTGLSLSKKIFVDFSFYNPAYESFYFAGIFLFYIVLIGGYLFIERKLNLNDKQRIVLFMSSFLLLIALTTVTVFSLNEIIKLLIGLPGGWAFRSPLKWQLYMPLALFSVLAVILYKIIDVRARRLALAGLGVSFLLANSFLIIDITGKLLTPRKLDHFATLQNTDLDNKTILFISSDGCMEYLRDNPTTKTELNQVFLSKNTQVKRIGAETLNTVNPGSYNYIIDCKGKTSLANTLKEQYKFNFVKSFANDSFKFYKNHYSLSPVYALDTLYSSDPTKPIDNKYNFSHNVLQKQFNFLTPPKDSDAPLPTTSLTDLFEDLSSSNLEEGRITIPITPPKDSGNELYVRSSEQALYYRLQGTNVELSQTKLTGFQILNKKLRLPSADQLTFSYVDSAFKPANIIKNPSLEQGTWQKKVQDCYAYDDRPLLDMKLNRDQKTDGMQSLQLETRNHVACSGPPSMSIKANENYVLTFDYQSLGKRYAGYNITFDDPQETSIEERLPQANNDWHSFTKQFIAPSGSRGLTLMLYAYPDTDGKGSSAITRYDNLGLVDIPPLRDRFYLVSNRPNQTHLPKNVITKLPDPTTKLIHVEGVSKPFYLASNETYHDLWDLTLNGKNAGTQVRLNNAMNGWYIDPEILCKTTSSCIQQEDGSYDLELVMHFTPQKWFYIGGGISATTALLLVIYFAYAHKRYKRKINWKGFQQR